MRSLDRSSKFKKQYKKVSSYKNFKKEKYDKAISQLMKGEQLDPIFDDHPVARTSPPEIQGCKIIHIAPNICIVYKLIDNKSISKRILTTLRGSIARQS